LRSTSAFFELGRTFEYPNILRKQPEETLRRFAAGGSGLILRWEALLLSALAMLPLVALSAVSLDASPALTVASVVVGSSWRLGLLCCYRRAVDCTWPQTDRTAGE
jgi:hypothetical protein